MFRNRCVVLETPVTNYHKHCVTSQKSEGLKCNEVYRGIDKYDRVFMVSINITVSHGVNKYDKVCHGVNKYNRVVMVSII